ncbi:plastocyanin/azurin family copper-binding protein [Rhodospirillaceae bacterium SYSU D60014]|uniref:plastocyanin/azurin family copper-binding protein n=1 Tax=Virgifigura deserti TaxID=2268457 RepID=UPI000E660E70
MITRRTCLGAGGAALAGLAFPALFRKGRAAGIVEIRMGSDPTGAKVWFDPIGLRIEPGQTVRWVLDANVHTSTAYHPANDGHPLRIPEAAEPWDSGYLIDPGTHFDVTLTVEGVYDYFCAPHEEGGMVGRIIVGKPGGPGARPFDDPEDDPNWKPVPAAARATFPSIETIMKMGVVRVS